MAKKRKVGNLLALAVLATVVQRPMHPYEIASVLRARGKETDMEIKWGSLYTVVRNLDKHGFLEVVDNERSGGRPERTIYGITDAGRAELVDWAGELVSTLQPEWPRFKAGLSVLAALTPEEADTLLRRRLDALERANAEAREALARDARDVPRLFLVEDEYELAIREAEAQWVRSLIGELASGTMPGLEMWHAWHSTGEIPAELSDVAERGGDAAGEDGLE